MYPDFENERPFAMPMAYVLKVKAMSRERLEEALLREAELRGKWEWYAGQMQEAASADLGQKIARRAEVIGFLSDPAVTDRS